MALAHASGAASAIAGFLSRRAPQRGGLHKRSAEDKGGGCARQGVAPPQRSCCCLFWGVAGCPRRRGDVKWAGLLAGRTLKDRGDFPLQRFFSRMEMVSTEDVTPSGESFQDETVTLVIVRRPIINNNAPQTFVEWPSGGGATAELIRSLDWSSNPLGVCEDWPQTQRIVTDLLLACPFPMIALWGPELIQVYNDGYLTLMGAKHPAGMGQPTEECWPEVWEFNEPIYKRVWQGETLTFEDQLFPILRREFLEEAYFSLSYSPIRDESQSMIGVLVSVFETTERVRAIQARERTEEARRDVAQLLEIERLKLTELFKQAPAFIAVLGGPTHIFEMANEPYQELVGERELIGKSVADALPEAEEQGFVALLNRVYETGEPYTARAARISLARIPGAPQEERYLDFVYQPMSESDGRTSGIICLGVDVTDRRTAENALIQSEKLAAVGRLASSIAHEINNPLEAITNLLYLATTSDELTPVIRGYLESAERELRRVSNIANQTLLFNKNSANQTAVFCQSLLADMLSIYQGRLFNARVQVEERNRASRAILCFKGEIRQVLSNLISNAIDALHPTGGRLLLRSREATNWKTLQKGVVLTIADTGPGMTSAVTKNIYDAFFTTKGIGGTGLGLWISSQIVDRHHGSIRVYSSQGETHRGTVFTVFLPFESRQSPGRA